MSLMSMLVVDDDAIFRERLAEAFRDRGYDVMTAADADEAINIARRESPERAVVDLRMPNGSGLDVLRELKGIDVSTTVVVLTGYGSIATAVEAMRLGATNYITKPANADQILGAFETQTSSALIDEEPGLSLARAEWEHIQSVLKDCSGNISETARRLGMHRRSLQRKLSKIPPRS